MIIQSGLQAVRMPQYSKSALDRIVGISAPPSLYRQGEWADFIETWGRGIEKIKDSCKEAGNPMPEYTIKREDIMVMFKSLVSNTDQATNQANQDNDNSVIRRILKVIQDDPSLSQKKIADVIGEKYSTVKYYMESMKKSGIIKREGSSQKGKWIIL